MKNNPLKKRVTIYIDAANLHRGVKSMGWDINYKSLYIWLQDKYKHSKIKVFMFIGFIPHNVELYNKLTTIGYQLIYKEVLYSKKGEIKGNCDADLVVRAMSDFYEKQFDSCVLVSSDGDYAPLVTFAKERNAFDALISPSNKCSYLLRKLDIKIIYLDNKKNKLEKKKPPVGTETDKGLSHSDTITIS